MPISDLPYRGEITFASNYKKTNLPEHAERVRADDLYSCLRGGEKLGLSGSAMARLLAELHVHSKMFSSISEQRTLRYALRSGW